MKHLSVILLLIATTQTASATCLQISEQRFESNSTPFGALEVQWKAKIDNQCDTGLNAALTVFFLDADGESVYETGDQTTLKAREAREVGKQVYVPSRYAEIITQIDVQAEEHERPY